ncbi:uncharacterized protein LOC142242472, partial [Haematobia irritans]|uniref:uncharacterized protein LOC142242472 n=1 Tax=Haematobia irritans TaxID=7368 RepID=UPI003F4FA16E
MEDFIFDSDDLVTFCADFEKSGVLTDTLLEVTLQDLHDRWSTVQKSYRRLCTTDLANLKNEDTEKRRLLESAREKYANCTKQFHKCKSEILDAQKALIAPTNFSSNHNFEESHAQDKSFSCIKVPPCDTEIFYGGYEEWPAFRDMFTAVYGEHPKLSAVQKLYHLRLKVKGQAATIVKKYKLCGENFSLAWEALKSRYENKRILVDNQLKILLNLEPVLTESSESIQEIQITINDCLAALKAQGIPTNDWDPILVYVCSTKLPHDTLALWEQSLKSHRELPKWSEMDTFLTNRYEVVERLNCIQGGKSNAKRKNLETHTFTTEGNQQFPCKFCKMNHALKHCPQFKALEPRARNEFAFSNKICLNCLSYTHLRKECKSKFVCAQCKKDHHTLLHYTVANPTTVSNTTIAPPQPEEIPACVTQTQIASHFIADPSASSENTLLPTAIVKISHLGETFSARAFIDQGSEKTFVSRRLQQKLRLPTESKNFQIRGMGGSIIGNSNSVCTMKLYSETHNRTIEVNAIVVPKITRLLPNFSFPSSQFSFDGIKDIDLADPLFYKPGQVDLLIGSNAIPKIMLCGVKTVCNSLIAQATIFGWIISGPVKTQTVSSFSLQASETTEDPISTQLRLFWEQEEVPSRPSITKEDEYCESLYERTTTRDLDGRYVVKLPFKPEFPHELSLGSSRSQAFVQYIRMEQSLRSKPAMEETYQNVLSEYLSLGHMKPTDSREIYSRGKYMSFYLPHHAVIRPESRSTKVRIVFNASKKSGSGNSLNDVLYVGPTLQSDMMTLILNWRLYKYVFSGDIEKMYRQIRVHEEDTPFQRILFRPTPVCPVKDYALTTVTFGVSSAPYLAIRTLIQLARDSMSEFPQAASILMKETYVDDILSGGHDLSSTRASLFQLIALLKTASFPLKKITSNSPDILASIPTENLLDSNFLKFQETSSTKTLGIQWNALSDSFSYKITPPAIVSPITKRKILSDASKLFDPAGWISPIIIQSKMLLQQLWLEGTKWDECVKPNTLSKWNSFVESLSLIPQIEIPRWVNFAPEYITQVHGFSDASEKAYCAVVYLRTQNGVNISSNLLVSKTKVAPIDPISLPRLELCGAVLLSKLISKILSDLPIKNHEVFLWCDFTIVLSWLEKPPCTWKTYVANRTAQIIQNVGNCSWRHVRSAENPADLGSRGCHPNDLIGNSLGWHGPAWLVNNPETWPKGQTDFENPPEARKIEVFHSFVENDDLLERFSGWEKAIRVTAYIFRFYKRISNKSQPTTPLNNKTVTHAEFQDARNRLIVLTQKSFFYNEYSSLVSSRKVHKKSPLYPLNPFIDESGIIRINGRISNSELPFKQRFPIILPVQSKFCKLFIDFTHKLLMHAEQSLMLRTIREEFYISRLRSAVKKHIRSCKVCVIYKHKVQSQIMAALPENR